MSISLPVSDRTMQPQSWTLRKPRSRRKQPDQDTESTPVVEKHQKLDVPLDSRRLHSPIPQVAKQKTERKPLSHKPIERKNGQRTIAAGRKTEDKRLHSVKKSQVNKTCALSSKLPSRRRLASDSEDSSSDKDDAGNEKTTFESTGNSPGKTRTDMIRETNRAGYLSIASARSSEPPTSINRPRFRENTLMAASKLNAGMQVNQKESTQKPKNPQIINQKPGTKHPMNTDRKDLQSNLPPDHHLSYRRVIRPSKKLTAPRKRRLRQYSTFLRFLPGEIRNRIYQYVIPMARIMIFATSPSAEVAAAQKLWVNQGKRIKQPRSRLYCAIDREQLKNGLKMSIAMLLVNKQVSREVQHFLYSQTIFCFPGLNVLCKFASEASKQGISSINSIELESGTYGEPYLTKNRIFKERYDRKWRKVCDVLGTQMPSLIRLKLYSHCVEWPVGKIEQTEWHKALMRIVQQKKLQDVEVHVTNPWFGRGKLAQLRQKIEESMMTATGQQYRVDEENRECLRLVSEAQRAESARLATLPPVQALRCLRITATPAQHKIQTGSSVRGADDCIDNDDAGQSQQAVATESEKAQLMEHRGIHMSADLTTASSRNDARYVHTVRHWEDKYGPGNTISNSMLAQSLAGW